MFRHFSRQQFVWEIIIRFAEIICREKGTEIVCLWDKTPLPTHHIFKPMNEIML